MPYSRPTLTALRNQGLQDIVSAQIQDSSGNTLTGLLPKSVLGVLSDTEAGLIFGCYMYLDWISKESVPWTATDEFLAAWGALIGVTRKDATAASGSVTFTGAGTPTIPSGSQVVRLDGFAYQTTADGTISSGTVTIPIVALAKGAAGNAVDETTLTLANPIAGVNSSGDASGAITGGADQEGQPAFRTRVLQQFAAPPQGGDRADYIEWSEAFAGVTRAWVAPNGMGPGTVVVFFMMDEAEAAFGGFPQGTGGVAANDPRDVAATGDQLGLANYLFAREPVTALVYCEAPTADPVNFTINNFLPNTTPVQNAVTAALNDLFFRLGRVGGTVNPADGSSWGTVYPSDIEGAIAGATGVQHFTLASPSAPIAPGNGQLFTVGTVTFNS